MAADQRKMAHTNFFKMPYDFVNNSRDCTKFEAQVGGLGCPFDFSYFDLGVKSDDLSMTLTFLLFGCKWRLAPKHS